MNRPASTQLGHDSQTPAGWGRRLAAGDPRIALAFVVVMTGFYLATAAGNLGETDDAYAFAYRAEHFGLDHISDPRLMLYHVAMRLLYLGSTAMGLDLPALVIMRAISALAAAASLVFVIRIAAADLRLSSATALLTAAVLGGSYGFWRYAAEAEVYLPAAFLILLVFRGLCAQAARGEAPVAQIFAALGWGSLGGLTVLFYQPSAIPLFLAFPWLLLGRGQWPALAAYLSAGALVIVAGYLAGYMAYWPEPLSLGAFGNFLSQRAGEFIVPPLSLRTIVVSMIRAAFALGHDIASANWVFAFDPVTGLIQRAFSNNVIAEEVFLAKRAGALPYLALATLLLLGAVALRALIVAWPLAWSVLRNRPVLVVLLWTAINGAVVGRLNPAGVEAWIMLLPPLALLFAAAVIEPCARKGSARLIAALAGILFLHNAVGGMALVAGEDGEYDRVKGAWVIEQATPDDLVIVAGNAGLVETLRYLSAAEVALIDVGEAPAVAEALGAQDLNRLSTLTRGRDFGGRFLRSLINTAGEAGGRVILFGDFFERPEALRSAAWPRFAAVEALREKATRVHEAPDVGATYVMPAPTR